jgi:peptidyl-prolyl cis-trans isomerase SurA
MATVQSHTGGVGSQISRHRRRPFVALALLMSLLASACGSASTPTPLVLGPDPSETIEPGVGATFAPAASLSAVGPPVATVDGAGIPRQEWIDRVKLIHFRYDRERAKLQRAIEAGTIDQAAAQDKLMELAARAADAESVAIDDLVDLAFQRILARDEGVTVTQAEVDAAQATESTDDPTFLTDLAAKLGLPAYRRNLEAETLAGKLRDLIVGRATAQSGEQVHLSEIYLQSDTAPNEGGDSGAVRLSQILYSPNHDPNNAMDLPLDDPAWAQAKADAQAAADTLRAIVDVKQRGDKFADTAKSASDDQDFAPLGGDMGWVSPSGVEESQKAALFDQPHQPGEVIGPVQISYGWVVELYVERRPHLAERVTKVQQRLAAPGADFATIAREESDGEEASTGGDLGWIAPFEADPVLEAALKTAGGIGTVIGPLTLNDGVHFYRVEGRETRSLSPDQRQQLHDTAFDTWYQDRRDAAVTSGRIVIPETSP